MAYFAVLSMFQLLVLGIVIGSYVLGEGEARAFVIEQVQAGTPIDAETIEGVIDSAIESRGAMTIIGFGFLLWSSLGIFSALSSGIGRVFENAPPRPFLKDKLVGLLLMGLTGLLAIASLRHRPRHRRPPGGGVRPRRRSAGRWDRRVAHRPAGAADPDLLRLLAHLPRRPEPAGQLGEVLPGAVVAALLWTVLRFGFTWYATSVADYESAFGPLATGITLLVFLYFASVIVLLGAEFARASALDDELGPHRSGRSRASCPCRRTGPAPAPMPRRGMRRWVPLAGAAIVGLLVGRLTKGDDD